MQLLQTTLYRIITISIINKNNHVFNDFRQCLKNYDQLKKKKLPDSNCYFTKGHNQKFGGVTTKN